ncbi:MAG: Gmad2 immunoglobulin-like domain-containing protein [Nocardioidaceae bacterium]
MNEQHSDDAFEARVREALKHEGAQIHPHGEGLTRIRERTGYAGGVTSRRRRWLTITAAGLATATAVAGALVVAGHPADRSTPEPATRSERRLTVPVYYLGDTTSGPRLFREWHRVQTSKPAAEVALDQMLTQPPDDPDYFSPWPSGSRALSVRRTGGVVTVDLSPRVRETDVRRGTADLMVQQLVYTVTAAEQTSDPVRILVQGRPVSEISGARTGEPLTRVDPLRVQALTWVTAPAEGSSVSRSFTVTGIANAFEATVTWQLLDGDRVVRDGFTTARQGQTFSPYSFRVRNVPPGDYTLKVYQESMEGGQDTFVDTKDVLVD